MFTGWYPQKSSKPRYMSAEQIAAACSISVPKVTKWFADNRVAVAATADKMFDAEEAIRLIIGSGLRVPASLLPLNTRKILFLADNETECAARAETMEQICHIFLDSYHVLASTTVNGRQADLSILTFAPDAVIIFLTRYNKSMANTFNLLTGMKVKVVLLVDDATLRAMQYRGAFLQADLVCRDSLAPAHIAPRLLGVLSN